jgi:hypothetical protein
MDKSTSTPSTSPLESIPKELLKLLTTFLSKNSQLALALTSVKLLFVYKDCLRRVGFLLLSNTIPTPVYLNDIKSSLKNRRRRRDGWGYTKVDMIVHDLSNLKYPSVDGICLDELFKLPEWISEYAERIRHISLGLFRNSIKDISFLKGFTNLESICLLGAKFNDSMMTTFSGLQPLFCLFLDNCKMGDYLPKIAKACKIEKFVLSRCSTKKGKITPPPQCRQLKFDDVDVNDLDLSDCSNLYKL